MDNVAQGPNGTSEQQLALPEVQEVQMRFRCSREIRRRLKRRAADSESTVERLVLEAVLRYLSESSAAAA